MKHCPNCLNEFRDDVDIEYCPDCNVKLLDGPNPKLEPGYKDPEQNEKDLVVLTKVGEQWQADLLKSRLEAEGILTQQVPPEQSVILHIPPIQTTNMITIYVNPDDYERAMEILKEIDQNPDTDIYFCPNCFMEVKKDDEVCKYCGFKLKKFENNG